MNHPRPPLWWGSERRGVRHIVLERYQNHSCWRLFYKR